MYSILVTLRDGRQPDEAEAILTAEIERLCQDGVSEAELNKARKQSKAAFAYSTESVTEQAYWLAQSFILGDVNWFDNYAERLMRGSAPRMCWMSPGATWLGSSAWWASCSRLTAMKGKRRHDKRECEHP